MAKYLRATITYELPIDETFYESPIETNESAQYFIELREQLDELILADIFDNTILENVSISIQEGEYFG